MKNRAFLSFGLLLLALVAVSMIMVGSGGCDDCCSTGRCSDCCDCQCASNPISLLPAVVTYRMFSEESGTLHLSLQLPPDQAWSSDLDRPPRSLFV